MVAAGSLLLRSQWLAFQSRTCQQSVFLQASCLRCRQIHIQTFAGLCRFYHDEVTTSNRIAYAMSQVTCAGAGNSATPLGSSVLPSAATNSFATLASLSLLGLLSKISLPAPCTCPEVSTPKLGADCTAAGVADTQYLST